MINKIKITILNFFFGFVGVEDYTDRITVKLYADDYAVKNKQFWFASNGSFCARGKTKIQACESLDEHIDFLRDQLSKPRHFKIQRPTA